MASVSLTSSIDFLPKFGIAASSFSDLETRSPIVSMPTRLRQLYERTPSSSSSIGKFSIPCAAGASAPAAAHAAKTYTVYEPNTPLPAVVVDYQIGSAGDPDLPALTVLDAILSKGQSSRLYQSLVYRQQLAAEVFTDASPTRDPGVLTLAAIMAQGKTAAQGEQALRAEAARLRDEPVSAAELDEAQTELVSDALRDRETADGKASDLAFATVMLGAPQRANTLLADIQRVTVADVQRVARKYLVDAHRVVIHYLDSAAKAGGVAETPIHTAATVLAAPLAVPASEIKLVTLAAPAERVAPPAPGDPIAIPTPKPSERTLANGLRVIVAADHALPLVSADLRVFAGASEDAEGRAGTASLAADLLTQGAAGRNATQIAQTIESLGAKLAADAGRDSSAVSLNARSDRLEAAFAVFADVVRKPTFAAEEVDRQRQQALDGLTVALREPGALADLAADRLVYGDAPYGRMAGGTPKSLAGLSPGDLAAFHQRWWRPDNAVLVLTGDIEANAGFALAERWLGEWARPATGLAVPVDADGEAAAAPGRAAVVIDLPDSGQSAVVVTQRGIRRKDPSYYPAVVANSLLGGGYSSRLNQEIRIKRGLSYGARSALEARLQAGPWSAEAQTKNESAVEVLDLIFAELKRMGSSAPSEAEVNARKAAVIGGFGRTIETTGGLSAALSQLAAYQLPLDTLDSFVPNIQAVSAEDVRKVAATLYDPATADVVVVGDAKIFLPKLQAEFPQLRTIPIAELKPDSAQLK